MEIKVKLFPYDKLMECESTLAEIRSVITRALENAGIENDRVDKRLTLALSKTATMYFQENISVALIYDGDSNTLFVEVDIEPPFYHSCYRCGQDVSEFKALHYSVNQFCPECVLGAFDECVDMLFDPEDK